MKLYAITGFHNVPGTLNPTQLLQDLWKKKKKSLKFLQEYHADQEYLDQVAKEFESSVEGNNISLPLFGTPDFSVDSSIGQKKSFYANVVCTCDFYIQLEKEKIQKRITDLVFSAQKKVAKIANSWKRYVPFMLRNAERQLAEYKNHQFYLQAICQENTTTLDKCLAKFIKTRLEKMRKLNKTFFFREKLLKEVKQLDFYVTHLEQVKQDREFPELPRRIDVEVPISLEQASVAQAFWFESSEEKQLLKDVRQQMTAEEQDEYLLENEQKYLYAERWAKNFVAKLIDMVRGPNSADVLKSFLMMNKSCIYFFGDMQTEHLQPYIELRGYVRRILAESLDGTSLKYLSRICYAFEEMNIELRNHLTTLKRDQAELLPGIQEEIAIFENFTEEVKQFDKYICQQALKSKGKKLVKLTESLAVLSQSHTKNKNDQLLFLEELFLIKTPVEILNIVEKFSDFFYKKKSNLAELFLYLKVSAMFDVKRVYKIFDKCADKLWNNDFFSSNQFAVFHEMYNFFHYDLLERQSDVHKKYLRNNPEVQSKYYDVQRDGETVRIFTDKFFAKDVGKNDVEILVDRFIFSLSFNENVILNLMGTFRSDNNLLMHSLSKLNRNLFNSMFFFYIAKQVKCWR